MTNQLREGGVTMETEMVNAWDTWYESGKAENANLRIAFDAGYKAALAELDR